MKYTESMRSGLLVIGLALIGAVATLPLAIESFRSLDAPSTSKSIGSVKLICFDRDMRALSCDVPNPALASHSTINVK